MEKKGKGPNKTAGTGKGRCEKVAAIKEIEARIDVLIEKLEEELKDVEIFGRIAEREDCPICFLPLPRNGTGDLRGTIYEPCCGKTVCDGCRVSHIDALSGSKTLEESFIYSCPFCRASNKVGIAEVTDMERIRVERLKNRIERANDTTAMMELAGNYYKGKAELGKDDVCCLRLYLQAAEVGDTSALSALAKHCYAGEIMKRNIHSAKKLATAAAKQGDSYAHYQLGYFYLEEKGGTQDEKELNNSMTLMAQHFAYAAKGGCVDAMKQYQRLFKIGIINHHEYAEVEQTFLGVKESEWSEERERVKRILLDD